jgi:hypothetical protein
MEIWEWKVAAAIVAAPFVVFGLIEFFAYRKRKRERAIAQRSKARR